MFESNRTKVQLLRNNIAIIMVILHFLKVPSILIVKKILSKEIDLISINCRCWQFTQVKTLGLILKKIGKL